MTLLDYLLAEDNFWNIFKSIGLIGFLGVLVSYSIYRFMRKSWNQSNRPFVTARVVPIDWACFALNLVLTNTGNRPAKGVKISLSRPSELYEAVNPRCDEETKKHVESCFQIEIPIIANGRELTASFGSLGNTWKNEAVLGINIGIRIDYRDIEDDRKFYHYQDIRLTSVDSFAYGVWKKPAFSVSVENFPPIEIKK